MADQNYVELDAGAAANEDAQTQLRDTIARFIIPLNSRAVLPDGSVVSREQILKTLNLNPGTAPDAWLAVIACGSNASALNFRDLRRIAARNLSHAARTLDSIEQLQADTASEAESGGTGEGVQSGGSAPKR
jgi:hypothetical protein